jgi:serine kinase of HPr protein (carbohydrate metabolism regulator)
VSALADDAATIYASAVLVGAGAILIRGPAGAGKSRLAFELIEAATNGRLPFARLVADDRVHVTAAHGRLVARAPASLAGLIEIRGIGICRLPHEPMAVVRLVVDLGTAAERMPQAAAMETVIDGIRLPRLAVAPGTDAFLLVLAALTFQKAGPETSSPDISATRS